MSVSADGFNASALWEELYAGLQDKDKVATAIKQVNAVLVVTLKNKEGKEVSWLLDLKKVGTLTKVEGSPPKGDVQLLLKDVDFVKLANGKANGQKLFMNGKLKIKGNMMKATALESVFKQLDPRPKAKLVVRCRDCEFDGVNCVNCADCANCINRINCAPGQG